MTRKVSALKCQICDYKWWAHHRAPSGYRPYYSKCNAVTNEGGHPVHMVLVLLLSKPATDDGGRVRQL